MGLLDFLTGSPEQHERVSTLDSGQRKILKNLKKSVMGQGAGGAFGDAADYYRDLLDDNGQTAQSMFAPEMRNYNEQIIPDLAEQFAGMGSGGLSSSGFRNAAVNAGTDLSERLGAIRAGLRQQGAAGLSGLGQQSLGNYTQDVVTQQGTQGMLAPALGAFGAAVGGPIGGQIGAMGGNFLSQSLKGKTSPYGNMASNASQVGGRF